MNKNLRILIICYIVVAVFNISISITSIKINQSLLNNRIIELEKKPTVNYLESVTVLIISTLNNKGFIGTGVVIKITDNNTYILTNKHVCDDNYSCSIKIGEKYYPLERVKKYPGNADVQILKTPFKLMDKTAIKGLSNTFTGDKVYVIGHYLSRPFTYSEGFVSGFYSNENNDLIINASIGPGNSGSGVFDSDGNLVGLVHGVLTLSRDKNHEVMDLNQGFCVNSKILKEFLNIN